MSVAAIGVGYPDRGAPSEDETLAVGREFRRTAELQDASDWPTQCAHRPETGAKATEHDSIVER